MGAQLRAPRHRSSYQGVREEGEGALIVPSLCQETLSYNECLNCFPQSFGGKEAVEEGRGGRGG